jgi:hypothetical protein
LSSLHAKPDRGKGHEANIALIWLDPNCKIIANKGESQYEK